MPEVRLAQFSRSEYGGKWGEPGDQLKVPGTYEVERLFDGECNIVERAGTWKYCFRLLDAAKANKLAAVAEETVRNPHVGYSQNNAAYPRTTFFDALKAAGWDPALITEDCNGDCSAGLAAWLNAVGIPVSKDMWTGNEKEALEATGAIMTLDQSAYLKSGRYLLRGDILLRDGHTAVVIDNGDDAYALPAETTADSWQRMGPAKTALPIRVVEEHECIGVHLPQINGRWHITRAADWGRGWESIALIRFTYRYRVTVYMANIRDAASLNGAVLCQVTNGQELPSTGRIRTDARGIWWYEVAYKNALGWISELMVERSM